MRPTPMAHRQILRAEELAACGTRSVDDTHPGGSTHETGLAPLTPFARILDKI